MTMITGLFKDSKSTEHAFEFVIDLGYDKSDINVIMSHDTREQYIASHLPVSPATTDLAAQADADKDTSTGDKLGGPVGGTIGTLAPVVAAVGVVLIPGIGIVAGPVAIALAAAGAVGIASGILGILANWGIPEPRFKEYEAGVHAGGILLGVKTKSAADAQKIQQRWQELGGEHIHL